MNLNGVYLIGLASMQTWWCVADLGVSGAVCTLGTVIIATYAHVQKNVMTDPECVPAEIGKPKSKTATSMGLVVRKENACR